MCKRMNYTEYTAEITFFEHLFLSSIILQISHLDVGFFSTLPGHHNLYQCVFTMHTSYTPTSCIKTLVTIYWNTNVKVATGPPAYIFLIDSKTGYF